MELVRDDGGVIDLKEGDRHELGRSSEFDVERDKSVSRLHVIAELLRPLSRKGKEVVGKSTALKLHVRVVGRNPICIITRQRAEDSLSPQIKFAGKGEIDWLAPGDKFTLSIRRPLFFALRQSSRGNLGGDEMLESHSTGRTLKPVENHLNRAVQKIAIMESNAVEEEEGIARAVARRQNRRLERETEQQRMRLSEQRQSHNGGREDHDRGKPDAESHELESVVPRQTNVLYAVNPVAEFGFIVKGSEFQAYEHRSKIENVLAWNWKIDRKGETEEDCFARKASDGESKMNINSAKNSRLEEEDENSGGDNKDDDDEEEEEEEEEEERVSKAIWPKAKFQFSTRTSSSNAQTLNIQLSNRSGKVSKDCQGLIDFSVEDNDSIEENDEYEDEWNDDDETVSHQIERKPANGEKQRLACKYGSKCYRKNEQHLSQFSHPQR